jgi:hypothetical protein
MCSVSETTVSAVVGVRNTTLQGFFTSKTTTFMSTNTLSAETQIRLLNFFNDRIEPEEMAKTLRQINFTLALGVMSEHESLQYEIAKLRDGLYWLNELAETLNPYLELE